MPWKGRRVLLTLMQQKPQNGTITITEGKYQHKNGNVDKIYVLNILSFFENLDHGTKIDKYWLFSHIDIAKRLFWHIQGLLMSSDICKSPTRLYIEGHGEADGDEIDTDLGAVSFTASFKYDFFTSGLNRFLVEKMKDKIEIVFLICHGASYNNSFCKKFTEELDFRCPVIGHTDKINSNKDDISSTKLVSNEKISYKSAWSQGEIGSQRITFIKLNFVHKAVKLDYFTTPTHKYDLRKLPDSILIILDAYKRFKDKKEYNIAKISNKISNKIKLTEYETEFIRIYNAIYKITEQYKYENQALSTDTRHKKLDVILNDTLNSTNIVKHKNFSFLTSLRQSIDEFNFQGIFDNQSRVLEIIQDNKSLSNEFLIQTIVQTLNKEKAELTKTIQAIESDIYNTDDNKLKFV